MELADIHCHLMPYVDDGAYDNEECFKLLKAEAEQGVRTICLTPHLRAEMFETPDEEILSRYAQVQELVREENLPIRLYQSREYHYDRLFRKRLEQDNIQALGDGDYLLVEFGRRHGEQEMLAAIKTVREAGYRPLIAHVERYRPVQDDWRFTEDLIDAGAHLQINAGSVLGREGFHQKQLCKKLLQNDLVTVIGSDAHDTRIRVPDLEDCRKALEKKYGQDTAKRLLCDNPLAILRGEQSTKGE